jgi:2'-5' RNA ligase
MGHAIAIKSANASAQLIESMWDACSTLEQEPSMRALNYPPHISLGIYDGASEATLFEAIDSVATKFEQFSITFDELKTFETTNKIILWAKPKVLGDLLRLHNKVHSIIDSTLCDSYYRPDKWIAHCTLATEINISRKAEVGIFIDKHNYSFEVVFDVIDCVSFFPIEVIREKNLQGTL